MLCCHFSLTGQRLQVIPGRPAQVIQRTRVMDLQQFAIADP
jgi:hypothetical protein